MINYGLELLGLPRERIYGPGAADCSTLVPFYYGMPKPGVRAYYYRPCRSWQDDGPFIVRVQRLKPGVRIDHQFAQMSSKDEGEYPFIEQTKIDSLLVVTSLMYEFADRLLRGELDEAAA